MSQENPSGTRDAAAGGQQAAAQSGHRIRRHCRRTPSPSDMRTELQRLKRDTESGKVVLAVDQARAVRVATLWKIAVPFLLVALLVAGGLYYRSHQQNKRLTEKDTIVLADFTNRTGDPIFDDTLKTALNVSL